jgi:putative addiction module component (TIGR02574 family)
MSAGASDILSAALSLPENERASIAFELLDSLRPPGILSENDPGFLAELERRSEAIHRDPSIGIPWEEVDRQIRQKLKDRRKP